MSRRLFLKNAVAWPIATATVSVVKTSAVAAVPQTAPAPIPATSPVAASTPVTESVRLIELQRSAVAGFQYYHGEMVWEFLREGDKLQLVAEPTNTHDARAVRVLWHGLQLGYVPRVDNAAICHLLKAGQTLQAQLMRRRDSDNPWDRLEFAVYLKVA